MPAQTTFPAKHRQTNSDRLLGNRIASLGGRVRFFIEYLSVSGTTNGTNNFP